MIENFMHFNIVMKDNTFSKKRNDTRIPGKLIVGDKEIYIKQIIYNDPATIVMWSDNTKTVAKRMAGDEYSAEFGVLMCIAKKLNINKVFKYWFPKEGSNYVTLSDVRNRIKNEEVK